MTGPPEKIKPSRDGFVIIPNPILHASGLSLAAKILFGVIYALTQGSHKKCHATNDTLAWLAGLNPGKRGQHVRDWLAALEKAGLISREKDEKSHRAEIRIVWRGGAVVVSESRKPRKTPTHKKGGGPTHDMGGVPTHKKGGGPTHGKGGGSRARSIRGIGIESTSERTSEITREKTVLRPASFAEPARLDAETEARLVREADAKKATWATAEAERRAKREANGQP